MNEISDGKLYDRDDLVKADCNDCTGCHSCCQGMGDTIKLDPYDVWLLKSEGNMTFEELMAEHIELRVAEGIILPNLKMKGSQERCTFLNEEGRCMIHAFRPGFCRLFPLGRIYEDRGFHYFLLVNECEKKNRTKIKVKKWLDVPHIEEYENFIAKWHYFLKDMAEMENRVDTSELAYKMNMEILQEFYLKDYRQNFFSECQNRMERMRKEYGVFED